MVVEKIILNTMFFIAVVAVLAPIHEVLHALGARATGIPTVKVSYSGILCEPYGYTVLQRFITGMAPAVMLFLAPVEQHFGAPLAVVAATIFAAIPSGPDVRFIFDSENVKVELLWEIVRAALTIAYIIMYF